MALVAKENKLLWTYHFGLELTQYGVGSALRKGAVQSSERLHIARWGEGGGDSMEKTGTSQT